MQGASHLQLLIGHTQLQDLIGQHMLHIADYLYLHIGLSAKVFTYDYKKVATFLPLSWHTTTWDYMSELGTTAHIPSLELKPQQYQDSTINSFAIGHYSGIYLQ